MKLRGRFTLTLALAALVPIALAAVITTRVIAARYRERYAQDRTAAKETIEREIGRLQSQVHQSAATLASPTHDFVGNLLHDFRNSHGNPSDEDRKAWRQKSVGTMNGLSLDVFTITGPGDVVLVSPHVQGALGLPRPDVRQLASSTGGKAYFTFEKVRGPDRPEPVLVAAAAQIAREENTDFTVAVLAARRVGDEVLASVRRQGQIDARIVRPDGTEIVKPAVPAGWQSLAKEPIEVPLLGADGKTVVATVQLAVSDGGLDSALFEISIAAGALATGALAAVVLLGLFVARRTARDLDRLVEGSVAAARGNLDHRVQVKSKDEVAEVANAFNLMMEDLKTSKEKLVIAERIAAWQEIARRLAHEIKNPLTPIQMAMDTLRKSWKKQHPSFEEILEESTTTVLQEADRLKKIVAEFSDFARMPKPEFGRIDLNEVVRSSLALYQGAVAVETKLDDRVPPIDADKNQVNQVILNLVENSRDAIGGREGGKIAVRTQYGEAKDRVVLTVEDNGPGVPTDLKDKVFAPYFTTKHTKGGTGLGLAIVHRIVSDHGGRITITDAPGGGAKFTIELPLRNGSALLASRI
jgi:two-component system nitrogen regulation sensor histidine kinase NtrY